MSSIQLVLISVALFLATCNLTAQNVYKTPSGKKYHLASCRMVETVSSKIVVVGGQIRAYGLTPCKICKPPQISELSSGDTANKAVGKATTTRCIGYTAKGTRCKHRTSMTNQYCYQHTLENSRTNLSNSKTITVSRTCGAKNKSGGYCKRKVKGAGRCHQHK